MARRRARGRLGRWRPRSPAGAPPARPREARGCDGRGAPGSKRREVAAATSASSPSARARPPRFVSRPGWPLTPTPGHAERTPAPRRAGHTGSAAETAIRSTAGSAAPSARTWPHDEEVEEGRRRARTRPLAGAVERRRPRERRGAPRKPTRAPAAGRTLGRTQVREVGASRAPSHASAGSPGAGNFRLDHSHSVQCRWSSPCPNNFRQACAGPATNHQNDAPEGADGARVLSRQRESHPREGLLVIARSATTSSTATASDVIIACVRRALPADSWLGAGVCDARSAQQAGKTQSRGSAAEGGPHCVAAAGRSHQRFRPCEAFCELTISAWFEGPPVRHTRVAAG